MLDKSLDGVFLIFEIVFEIGYLFGPVRADKHVVILFQNILHAHCFFVFFVHSSGEIQLTGGVFARRITEKGEKLDERGHNKINSPLDQTGMKAASRKAEWNEIYYAIS